MPSATVETSADNFVRIIAALRAKLDPDAIEGLTNEQIWRLDLEGYYTGMLYKHDCQRAKGAVTPEDDIVEVT